MNTILALPVLAAPSAAASGAIAGTSAATATATGTLTGAGALAGSSAAVATATGSLGGTILYVAAAGNDSSTAPWNQATPYLTIGKAFAVATPGQVIAPKGGEIFRATARLTPTNAGTLAAPCAVDGSLWGTGKPQVRFSTAPALTLQSGTVYKGDALSDEPVGYVFYVPGGAVTFDATYQTNVVRLTKDAATPTTPAVGKWGYSGGFPYFNTGAALSQGDIEVSVPGLSIPVLFSKDYWSAADIVIAFAEDRGFQFGLAGDPLDGVSATEVEVWFAQSDGFDGFGSGVHTVTDCKALWCGRAPTDAGAFGDGGSWHDGASGNFVRCQMWWNDKSGFVHQANTNTTHRQCIAVGSKPWQFANFTSWGGSMLVENCIAVVPDDALVPEAIRSVSTGDASLTVRHSTIYSLSSPAAGAGVYQSDVDAPVTAQNNVIKGFATGLRAASGATNYTADHNCLHGNTANYSNVSAGTGDVAADPLFTDAVTFDFSLLPGSPCIDAGADLGILVDYDGDVRPLGAAPDIGAYEAVPTTGNLLLMMMQAA